MHGQILPLRDHYVQEHATFVKAIHVELSYKGRNICMLEVLSEEVSKEHKHVTSAIPTQELLRIQKMAT